MDFFNLFFYEKEKKSKYFKFFKKKLDFYHWSNSWFDKFGRITFVNFDSQFI